MTAREMQQEVERRISLIDPTFEVEGKLTSDTIFSFLNAYTQRYVKLIYLQRDNITSDTRAQKGNIDQIKNLISNRLLVKHDTNKLNQTDLFVLPQDYFLYIRSNSIVSSNYKSQHLQHKQIVTNEIIDADNADKVTTTAYNHIILRNPQVVLSTDNDKKDYLNVIHDKFTQIETVDLYYYRKPREFNVLGVDNINVLDYCELPESMHMDIVEGAVEMIITEGKYRLSVKNKEQ